jgi:hypothetical protein
LTPVEITKQYLTNPNLVQPMSLYTFDKEELLKLRKDVFENPEKYEKMLTDFDIEDTFDMRHKK